MTRKSNGEFQIEPGVPLPPRSNGKPGNRYPFAEMNTGDSFFVEGEYRKLSSRITHAATNYRRRTGVVLAVRRVDGGVRVWRTA